MVEFGWATYGSDLCVLGVLRGERLLDWNIAALLLSKGLLPPRAPSTPRRLGWGANGGGRAGSLYWSDLCVLGVLRGERLLDWNFAALLLSKSL